MINDIYNSVCDVVNIIWEHLHFSVSEKRPLTSVNEWMSDFMKNLADGINKNKKLITKAISGVADVMSLDMDSQLGISMTASMKDKNPYGTVVNNYNNDNSRTVNQTNNSPKSLSRLEIYRMTRNALG